MKRYKDIDYTFQPESYWLDSTVLQALLRDVKGVQRRKMIVDYYENGTIDQLEDTFLQASLSEDQRQRFGLIHPSFMGGEYLPDCIAGETEIARIELQSTTADVISVRARPVGESKIGYRIVDEDDSNYKGLPETSAKPLSLEELIQLIDYDYNESGYGGFGIGYNISNAEWADYTDLRNFTTVTSFTYMDLYDHYDAIHEEWWEGLSLV